MTFGQDNPICTAFDIVAPLSCFLESSSPARLTKTLLASGARKASGSAPGGPRPARAARVRTATALAMSPGTGQGRWRCEPRATGLRNSLHNDTVPANFLSALRKELVYPFNHRPTVGSVRILNLPIANPCIIHQSHWPTFASTRQRLNELPSTTNPIVRTPTSTAWQFRSNQLIRNGVLPIAFGFHPGSHGRGLMAPTVPGMRTYSTHRQSQAGHRTDSSSGKGIGWRS